MMVERSAEGSAAEEDAEMSHDSKAEKRMEVETPPSNLPKRSVGTEGTVMQTHVRVYVIQKTRQSFRRPLGIVKYCGSFQINVKSLLLVRPNTNQRSCQSCRDETSNEENCN